MTRLLLPLLMALLSLPALADNDLAVTLSPPPYAAIGHYTTCNVKVDGSPGDDVTLTFSMPAGATFLRAYNMSYDDTSVTCARPPVGTNGIVTCHTPYLYYYGANIQVAFYLPAGVTPGTQLMETATVKGTRPDPNPANNTATATTTVKLPPDLEITTTYPATLVAGAPTVYMLTLTNGGKSPAGKLRLWDYASIDDYAWFINPASQLSGPPFTVSSSGYQANEIFVAGALKTGETAQFAFTIVDGPWGYNPVSTHELICEFQDYGYGIILDETARVLKVNDVAIATSAPAQVTINSDLAYSIAITNAGPSAADATFTWTTPPGTTFQSISVGNVPGYSLPAVHCNTPDAGIAGTVKCTAMLFSAAPGFYLRSEGWSMVIHVRAPATPGSVTNTASVAAAGDPNLANNTSSATTQIVSSSAVDLALTATASATVVSPGAELTYDAYITNIGTTPANDVVITATFPAGVTVLTAPQFSVQGPVARGTLSSILPRASAWFHLVVRAPSTPGPFTATFNAVSSADDIDPTNNTRTVTVNVGGGTGPVLGIASDPKSLTLIAAQFFTFTIRARNDGNAMATNADITDALPAAVTFVSATPSAGSCIGTGPIVCHVGDFPAGGSATVTIAAYAPLAGTVTNIASVASGAMTASTETTITVAPTNRKHAARH